MAIYYLDPEAGNDANDGTTFVTRWQTVQLGATSARTAPGDEIRVIASPDPTALGDATWTDGNSTVVLAVARNVHIDQCETAWTASASVTCSTSTGARKQGAAYASFSIASAFTTGKIAHRTLPATLDLSAYQQLSFWIYTSTSQPQGRLELRLCTDTTGNTPVHTIAVPDVNIVTSSGGWMIWTWDAGAPLSSTINSLALYANSDPGTMSIYLDNIVACKAPSSAECITHCTLIGKNTVDEPEWYPILAINEETLQLGPSTISSITAPQPYRGITETTATYARQPIRALPSIASGKRATQRSGTPSASIRYTGGWSRADMSAQTGETWLTGSNWASYTMEINTDYIELEKLAPCHTINGGVRITKGTGVKIALPGTVGNNAPVTLEATNLSHFELDCGNVVHNYSGLAWSSYQPRAYGQVRVAARRVTGTHSGSVALPILSGRLIADIERIDNGAAHGFIHDANTTGQVILRNTVFANNASGSVLSGGSGAYVPAHLVRCVLEYEPSLTGAHWANRIYCHDYNRIADDHRLYSYSGNVFTDATVTTDGTGYSWRIHNLRVTDPSYQMVVNATYPFAFALGRVAVAAGIQVSVTVQTRRDHAGMQIGLRIPGGDPGAPSADLEAYASGAIDAWVPVTLTWTPSLAGVVELVGIAHADDSTRNGWWDTVSVATA